MAFLDEELEAQPQREETPRRREREPGRKRQQFVFRRLIAVGAGLLVLLLMVLGVRGCLDARKERAIENYVRDISSVVTASAKVGEKFFDAVESPSGTTSAKDLEGQLLQLRTEAGSLVDRTDSIDSPGELSEADQALRQTLELRRDSLGRIAENVTKALGTTETAEAVTQIEAGMRGLFASDVLYEQLVVTSIRSALEAESLSVSGPPTGPAAAFFPEGTTPEEYLDQAKIAEILSGVTGAEASGATRGLELAGVLLNGTALDPTVVNTLQGRGAEVEVQVTNGGEQDETGLEVSVSLNGEEVTGTIDTLAPGETGSVTIPLRTLPQPGTEATLEVVVPPVPGELLPDNNQATYTLTLG